MIAARWRARYAIRSCFSWWQRPPRPVATAPLRTPPPSPPTKATHRRGSSQRRCRSGEATWRRRRSRTICTWPAACSADRGRVGAVHALRPGARSLGHAPELARPCAGRQGRSDRRHHVRHRRARQSRHLGSSAGLQHSPGPVGASAPLPEPRYDEAVATLDGRLYVIGGRPTAPATATCSPTRLR